jgi:hypothetical protein
MEIQIIESKKDKLKERFAPASLNEPYLPTATSRTIIIGGSGSGKTNVLVNMLSRNDMLKSQYDEIYLLSETAKSDDIVESLKLKKHCVFDDLEQGRQFMEKILNVQDKIIKRVGADKAPIICCILDDCISNKAFMKSDFLKKIFVQGRHRNCGMFILSQHLTSVPPAIRNQCENWIYFQSPQSSDEIMASLLCPPAYSKSEFKQILKEATRKRFSFMYINRTLPWKKRYRINFNQIIDLTKLSDE